MNIQDIIRSMIDMIDGVKEPEEHKQVTQIIVAHPTATIAEPEDVSPFSHAPGDDINRWRQIVDLADNTDDAPIGNTPKEKYADIDSVTKHAGGGLNGPKDPADIKSSTISMFPDFVARRSE